VKENSFDSFNFQKRYILGIEYKKKKEEEEEEVIRFNDISIVDKERRFDQRLIFKPSVTTKTTYGCFPFIISVSL